MKHLLAFVTTVSCTLAAFEARAWPSCQANAWSEAGYIHSGIVPADPRAPYIALATLIVDPELMYEDLEYRANIRHRIIEQIRNACRTRIEEIGCASVELQPDGPGTGEEIYYVIRGRTIIECADKIGVPRFGARAGMLSVTERPREVPPINRSEPLGAYP